MAYTQAMAVRFGWAGLLALAEVASIVGIVGCAAPRLRLEADAEPSGTSYSQAFSRWTREGSVVSLQEFDTTLVVSATLRSRAFQRAYTERYISTYHISDAAEQSRVEKVERELADSGVNFWVRTACHNPKANDLLLSRGRWRVSLLVEPEAAAGHGDPATQPAAQVLELLPDEVTQVTRGEAVEAALFNTQPDIYRRTWHVRFPRLPQKPGKLTLRFAGPDGKTDLVWQLE
jgi:hypothetical protein